MKRAITLKSPKTTSNRRVDPDNPPWSEEMLGPQVLKRGRGPQKAPTKVLTTVRLDADVLAFFKAQGSGYQTRINDELRKVVAKGLTARSSPRTWVPGMARNYVGGSPTARFSQSRRLGKRQGRCREAGSERSRTRNCGAMNKNRI